jgi:hypothetical protein
MDPHLADGPFVLLRGLLSVADKVPSLNNLTRNAVLFPLACLLLKSSAMSVLLIGSGTTGVTSGAFLVRFVFDREMDRDSSGPARTMMRRDS